MMSSLSATLGDGARKFFGLSRMSHSVLDVAHPAVGALLVLGAFPRPSVIGIGLLAAFAGFTAVFALNDVLDRRVDAEKMAKYKRESSSFDLDSLGLRHPIAQGKLPFWAAVSWVIFWGVLSVTLAYLLNPVCALLLLAAAALETVYCLLLRVTHWKGLLSGAMVAVGGLAGVYAVNPLPPAAIVFLFFAWAFAWEVGCRNIPNDWTDLDEDIHLGIRTVPVRYGRLAASWISFSLTALTVAASLAFPVLSPVKYWPVYEAGALAAGAFFLIIPALGWARGQCTEAAMAFFNRACFYPLSVLAIVAIVTLI
jgi:4-hydroxybenzoate polyprenyltransferase